MTQCVTNRERLIELSACTTDWIHRSPTPLGTNNPGWVPVNRDGQERRRPERLYFVVDTKSSLFEDDLRERESGKIKCGTAQRSLEVRTGQGLPKFVGRPLLIRAHETISSQADLPPVVGDSFLVRVCIVGEGSVQPE